MMYPGNSLADVIAERERQEGLWGQQNHPDGTGPDVVWELLGSADRVAMSARADCEQAFAAGRGTWLDILLEEVAEAFAEDDPVKLRKALVQAAAVTVAWIEAIDRRKKDSD